MINPNEAPEGYTAAQSHDGFSCTGCAFSGHLRCEAPEDASCGEINRTDKTCAIFIKKEATK